MDYDESVNMIFFADDGNDDFGTSLRNIDMKTGLVYTLVKRGFFKRVSSVVAAKGAVFVKDDLLQRVFRVSPDGNVTPVAGNGDYRRGGMKDNTPASGPLGADDGFGFTATLLY